MKKISELSTQSFLGGTNVPANSYVLINYAESGVATPVTKKVSVQELGKAIANDQQLYKKTSGGAVTTSVNNGAYANGTAEKLVTSSEKTLLGNMQYYIEAGDCAPHLTLDGGYGVISKLLTNHAYKDSNNVFAMPVMYDGTTGELQYISADDELTNAKITVNEGRPVVISGGVMGYYDIETSQFNTIGYGDSSQGIVTYDPITEDLKYYLGNTSGTISVSGGGGSGDDDLESKLTVDISADTYQYLLYDPATASLKIAEMSGQETVINDYTPMFFELDNSRPYAYPFFDLSEEKLVYPHISDQELVLTNVVPTIELSGINCPCVALGYDYSFYASEAQELGRPLFYLGGNFGFYNDEGSFVTVTGITDPNAVDK